MTQPYLGSGRHSNLREGRGGNDARAHAELRVAVWRAWTWANWLLPVLFVVVCVRREGASWEGLIVLALSPVLVPTIALLSSIPRCVLRRRGWVLAPRQIVVPLLVCWGGTLLANLIFHLASSEFVSGPLIECVFLVGLVAGLGSWAAAFALAFRQPAQSFEQSYREQAADPTIV